MVIGVVRGLLLKHDRSFLNDFGGPITLTKDWAICVMRCMGYAKRRANSKPKVLPQDFKDIKEQYCQRGLNFQKDGMLHILL